MLNVHCIAAEVGELCPHVRAFSGIQETSLVTKPGGVALENMGQDKHPGLITLKASKADFAVLFWSYFWILAMVNKHEKCFYFPLMPKISVLAGVRRAVLSHIFISFREHLKITSFT